MKIVSYAQNFEDIILWRALKDINNGVYVDVGANDSQSDSVTKLFYDKGWSGINIEPLSVHFEKLKKDRKRDINLCCAIGEKNETLEIWQCDVPGWATLDKSVAHLHEKNNCKGTWHSVSVKTLNSLLADYYFDDIHFLKIDVEGFEKEVIKGNDWKKNRPWIVVVEAITPVTQEECYEVWENIVLESEYDLVYADGLNRFYLAKEHMNLLDAFKYPPNILDEFVRFESVQAEEKARKAETELADLSKQLDIILNSNFWRLSRPLRIFSKELNKISQ